MARVVFTVVETSTTVLARRRITLVYSGLTVQSGIPANTIEK